MLKAIILCSVLLLSGTAVRAQEPCYFGECDSDAPRKPQGGTRSNPRAEPPPAPVPPAPAPAGGEPPAFLARNMCVRGSVAVPVTDLETCNRIYHDRGARPKHGGLVECAVLQRRAPDRFQFYVARTQTLGDCFDLSHEALASTGHVLCTRVWNGRIHHWKYVFDRSECRPVAFFD